VKRFVLSLILLWITVAPCGAAVVYLVDDGAGQFRVQGENLFGVASIDLTLTYDTQAFKAEMAMQGQLLEGMMFVSNLNTPGVIRIGAIGSNDIHGGGTLVTIKGDLLSSAPYFSSMTIKMKTAENKEVASSTSLPVYQESVAQSDPTDQSSTNGPTNLLIKQAGSSIPDDVTFVNDEKPPPTTASASLPEGQRTPESSSLSYEDFIVYAATSPQNRFRSYKGERTLSAMIKLFDLENSTIQQAPYPAISDGTTEVTISLPAMGNEVSSLGVANAKLISSTAEENRWDIKVVPYKGVSSAKVLVLGLEQMIEIPLVVVPGINLGSHQIVTERLLPRLDVNADGTSDWKDDFLLIGNYLSASK